jgi:hypothetical protein
MSDFERLREAKTRMLIDYLSEAEAAPLRAEYWLRCRLGFGDRETSLRSALLLEFAPLPFKPGLRLGLVTFAIGTIMDVIDWEVVADRLDELEGTEDNRQA